MNFLKSILISIIFCGAFNSVNAQIKDWTLLVYMVGSDLQSKNQLAEKDLAEIRAVANTNNAHIIVLRGGANMAGWTIPTAWQIVNGQETKLAFNPTTQDMGDPAMLTQFINLGMTAFPSYKKGLILWNHGGGIDGFGADEVSNNMMSVPQLEQAFANSVLNPNFKFDLIGFDACLMATLEVQSRLAPFADYFVGSEELEPGHGWDYTPIIRDIGTRNDYPADSLGITIVNGFRDQAIQSGTRGITLSVVGLNKIQFLQAGMAGLFSFVQANHDNGKLLKAISKTENYHYNAKIPFRSSDLFDVKNLLDNLKTLDNSYAFIIDTTLSLLDSAVIYNYHDWTRPHSNGISMYIPFYVLPDQNRRIAQLKTYNNIAFDSYIQSFITNLYTPAILSDQSPPRGTVDRSVAFKTGGDSISALKIVHDNDLDQVQVVLAKEMLGTQNKYELLGAASQDTIISNLNGTETYAYKWDDHWLGIKGHPVYIADFHSFSQEDNMGNPQNYTRIQIPAILNPGTAGEKDIKLIYRYDEKRNMSLESIFPNPIFISDSLQYAGKERIKLISGDVVQFVYEVWDNVLNENYFVPNPTAQITIVTGNSDLQLTENRLPQGNYQIGYILKDHSQNETIIFDPTVFSVGLNAIDKGFLANQIFMFPNPAEDRVTLDYSDFSGKPYQVTLINIEGKQVFQETFQEKFAYIQTHIFPKGIYFVELSSNGKSYRDKLIIK